MKTFFKILRFGKPYKKHAFLNIFFNLVSILAGLASLSLVMPFLKILFERDPVIVKPEEGNSFNAMYENFLYVLKLKTQENPEKALIYVCILVVVAVLVKNSARYFATFFMVSFRSRTINDIREQLYLKNLRLPISFFSEKRKGDMISRMGNDVKEIEIALMTALEALFKEPFTILVYLGFLIYISPSLTLFVFILLPVTGLIIGKIGKTLRGQSGRTQEKMGALVSLFEETLSGMRVIKAFNAEAFFMRRFIKENRLVTSLHTFINRRIDLASPMSESMGVSVLAILLLFGGKMVFSGELKAEVFIGYIGIFTQLIPPSKAFSSAFYSIQKGSASIDRINEVLITEERIPEKENALPVENFTSSLELRNVSFGYDRETVLNNINVRIEKGKTVALVGPSGGGKSTLADLIPRFYDPTSGGVFVDGTDIRDFKVADLRGLMGIVSQESILFNDTIYNNIAFGQKDVSTEQIIEAAKIANAHDFIMETEKGYQTNIGERGSKLSGGQRQRISIARAVLKNPQILILDEATSALDTTSERLVQDALNKLMKNRTSLVIAHRLSTIQNADWIVVLEKGSIVQQGKHQQLLEEEGLYRNLNLMQFSAG